MKWWRSPPALGSRKSRSEWRSSGLFSRGVPVNAQWRALEAIADAADLRLPDRELLGLDEYDQIPLSVGWGVGMGRTVRAQGFLAGQVNVGRRPPLPGAGGR